MDRAIEPGSVCVRTSFDPGSGLARRTRGSYPLLARYRARLFFLCGVLPPEGSHMAIARDELATDLHRLSNQIECQLGDFLQQLLAESRHEAVTDLAWAGTRFIQSLRSIRDNKECEGCNE